MRLGHQLVDGEVKRNRMEQWQAFAEQHPNGYLYCFRGGLRSQTVQRWLAEVGINYPLIVGGYKALRRFLIEHTIRVSRTKPFFLMSGLTGVGKTVLLNKYPQAIDLESLANHRGSSFGAQISSQPPQVSFENGIAEFLLKHSEQRHAYLLLEDEARMIGSRSLPHEFYRAMTQAPIIVVKEDFSARVENIFQEYIIGRYQEFVNAGYQDPHSALDEFLSSALYAIRKRLGNERFKLIHSLIDVTIEHQRKFDNFDAHRSWISVLLREYYDPMYEFQLSKKHKRVIFEGNRRQVEEFMLQVELPK